MCMKITPVCLILNYSLAGICAQKTKFWGSHKHLNTISRLHFIATVLFLFYSPLFEMKVHYTWMKICEITLIMWTIRMIALTFFFWHILLPVLRHYLGKHWVNVWFYFSNYDIHQHWRNLTIWSQSWRLSLET